MKKLLTIALLMLLSVTLSAEENQPDPVSMVSFEQAAHDFNATIALKNNTQEEIHNVQYTIEYLDMKGNQMDYEEYNSVVDIAPGKTRKVEISAYEHMKYYSYYKSKASAYDPHKFKVNYVFTSYNQAEDSYTDTYDLYTENSIEKPQQGFIARHETLFLAIIVLMILSIYIGLYVLVAVVANRNQRNAILWVLLSFVGSPLLILIILLCIGKSERENDY